VGEFLFRFLEKPGPHGVGLRVVEQYDRARAFGYRTDELGKVRTGERTRPLQTLMWYPAAADGRPPMTIRSYVSLLATETSFGRPIESAGMKEWTRGLSAALNTPLWAVRDAAPLSGRFPVVIYAPSMSSLSWENADLCEYLASHGFMVLATPCMGARTRNGLPDLAGADAQATDISFLIGYAETLPNTDCTKVAVMGFSWGGISNVFAAERDNRISALIALDGTLRAYPALLRQGNVLPAQMSIPLLSIHGRDWSLEDQARFLSREQMDGPNVLNAWVHADTYNVQMLGMTHRQFSSIFQRNEDIWSAARDPESPYRSIPDYTREDSCTAYAWVARYVRQFLNAYLKQDAGAMSFLRASPESKGVPAHFMEVSYRVGQGIVPSFEAFRAQVGARGFAKAAEALQELRRSDPEFKPTEATLIGWANGLLDLNLAQEAVELLQFTASLYPQSGVTYWSLATAWRARDEQAAAIEAYRKVLDLFPATHPIHLEARNRLRELETATVGKG